MILQLSAVHELASSQWMVKEHVPVGHDAATPPSWPAEGIGPMSFPALRSLVPSSSR
ncbi:MAG: hypothetical protein AAB217_14970 [Chloroflexota bacterium]